MAHATKSVYSLIEDAKKTLNGMRCHDVYNNLYKNDDFASVNAYIAHKASLENRNIYIGTSENQSAQELTIPILFPEACRILLENASLYPDYIKSNCIGRKFIVDGNLMRYSYKRNEHTLVMRIKNGKRMKHFKCLEDIISRYYIVDESYDNESRCNQSLSHYHHFFQELSGSMTIPPSMFYKKVIVISKKNELFEDLRRFDLFHVLPIAGITKNHNEPTNSSLPIEPMILVASDYELAREYVQANHDTVKFDFLLFNGDSKISKVKALVKNDCANGLFSRFCLVGNQPIAKDNSMLLWHWHKHEEINLRGRHSLEFIPDPLDKSEELIDASNSFYTLLNQIQEDLEAPVLISKLRYSFMKILYDKLGTITDFDLQVAEQLKEDTEKAMRADNYDLDEFADELEKLILTLKKVYLAKQNTMTIMEKIQGDTPSLTTLVVDKRHVEEWQKLIPESKRFYVSVITFKDFKKKLVDGQKIGRFFLAMSPNYEQIVWLHNISLQDNTSIHLALYKPEIMLFQTKLRQIRRYESRGVGPKDTSLFPNLRLKYDEREATEDVISRFEEKYSETAYEEGAAYSGYRSYSSYSLSLLDSANNMVTETSPSKVLRFISESAERTIDNDFELVLVPDLEEGDKILLYYNRSMDSLYRILSQESKQFSHINESSNLWKTKIKDYLYNQAFTDSPLCQMDSKKLQRFSVFVGLDPESIRSRWVIHSAAIRFPQKTKMDRVLSFLKTEELLTHAEVDEIRSARSFFMGFMIHLGQNFSNELQSILLNKEADAKIYITRHVIGNNYEYPTLYQFDVYAILSILNHNYAGYVFQKIIDKGVDFDE